MTPKERAVMQQALKAMKDASPYGLTFKEAIIACEEVLEIRCHGCDYCNNPLFAGTKCNNCGRVVSQPVSQEYQDHLVNQSFDWSAMAAKHQFMEGYRIGLAEMREKCATASEQGTGEAVQKAALELLLNERKRIAAAIRAIKFEGDTGFRPVSEMIAEHKQDTKKAAAIEKAKMRKATRAEKIAMPGVYEVPVEQAEQEPVAWRVRGYNQFKTGNPAPWRYVDGADKPTVNKPDCCDFEPLYAAPVRTKDLTDDEIAKWFGAATEGSLISFARAVIAAYKEKNK